MFSRMFQVIITNEVPVTIVFAYCTSFFRPIGVKGFFVRRIIASHLHVTVGGQHFRTKSRKPQKRIMFERYFSFFIIVCRLVVV